MSDNKNRNRLSTAGNGVNGNQTPTPTPVANQVSTIDEKKTDDASTNSNSAENQNETKAETTKLTKAEKLQRMRDADATKKERDTVNAMKKMELFDSTKASDWETAGNTSLGSTRVGKGEVVVSGRNIGAEQREPKWSKEQLDEIRRMSSTTLSVMQVTDTRRSVADPAREYVTVDENNTFVPTEKAYASALDPSQYCIGIGEPKYDTTGSPRYYSDVVIADINGQWLVNQWTSEGIVIEGVATNVLMQPNRTGNTSGRKIGKDFARIGLPKYAFGPLFHTLNTNFIGTGGQISSSEGYYWMNASWGVSSFPATFSFMTENGLDRATNLQDVMRIINGKSSLSASTIAISITAPAKMVEGKPTMDTTSYGLSVKLHNAFHIDIVDYHGPPQQGSTGMLISNRLVSSAKRVTRPGTSSVMNAPSIFAGAGKGIFGQVSSAPPTIKSADNASFM